MSEPGVIYSFVALYLINAACCHAFESPFIGFSISSISAPLKLQAYDETILTIGCDKSGEKKLHYVLATRCEFEML